MIERTVTLPAYELGIIKACLEEQVTSTRRALERSTDETFRPMHQKHLDACVSALEHLNTARNAT